ncbi:MAG: L,D-transpeptidase family protein [Sphingomonadaceae bacterium]
MTQFFTRCFAVSLLALAVPATPVVPGFAAHAVVSDVQQQIKSASSGKYKRFYKDRSYLPIWSRGGTMGPEAETFIAILRSADQDGLDPDDYSPDALADAVADARAGKPKAIGKAELKLSKAFYAYVRDLRDPRRMNEDVIYVDKRLVPKRLAAADVLLPLAIAPSLPEYLDGMRWMSPFYVDLRTALAGYHKRWGSLPAVPIAPGPTLRVGIKDARVSHLRQRLGLAPGTRFDKAIVQRLKQFQADHGLRSSGVVDAETVIALNRGPGFYEAKMQLNLNRARALPPASVRHLVVNLPQTRLWMIDGKLSYADSMRVIVGAPDEKTPIMAGMVSYAILNPYWNVPTDLVQRRVAPKVLAGQSFTSMRYEALSDWTVNAAVIPPDQIDWKAVADGSQQLRVRQLPGGNNFMGVVKFMLPNDLGIYLHDFPDKSLFRAAERHISSGCVRLENAERLGKWLYGKPLRPSSKEPEQFVPLPDPVPVYMAYLTVVPDNKGIAFLADPYSRDDQQRYARR